MGRYFSKIHFAMLDGQFFDRCILAEIEFVERYLEKVLGRVAELKY